MKGQAFSVFKILIGAVFAVVLLSIVYYVTANNQFPSSGVLIIKTVANEANNAQELCFSRKFADFSGGETIRTDAQYFSAIKLDCFVTKSGAFSCSDGTSSCYIECSATTKVTLPVSAKCTAGTCTVFLGSDNCDA